MDFLKLGFVHFKEDFFALRKMFKTRPKSDSCEYIPVCLVSSFWACKPVELDNHVMGSFVILWISVTSLGWQLCKHKLRLLKESVDSICTDPRACELVTAVCTYYCQLLERVDSSPKCLHLAICTFTEILKNLPLCHSTYEVIENNLKKNYIVLDLINDITLTQLMKIAWANLTISRVTCRLMGMRLL